MKIKKPLIGFLMFATLLGISIDANAWFFFFIPGSVTRKIGDALTGSEGENCVGPNAKVGDTITSATGNTATVVSLSGSSSICRDERLPIRAKLQFQYSFSSKAGIELPDTFTNNEVAPVQRFNGMLLRAHDESRKVGVVIHAQPRKAKSDGGEIAQKVGDNILHAVDNGKLSNSEELTINGMHAYRFEAVGKNKGMFGRSYSYVVTVLEGSEEYVIVNTNCLTDDFANFEPELKKYAFDVRGLDSADGAVATDADSKPAPVGQIDTNPVPSAPVPANKDPQRAANEQPTAQ